MSRLALITGASRGIGLAISQRFIAAGWDVLNLARSHAANVAFPHIVCDLGDPQTVDTALTALTPQLAGRSQIALVHNASLLLKDSYETLDSASFQQALQVNLLGPQQLNNALIPLMPAGSSVIFIGSTLSEKAAAGTYSYTTTKHAQAGMMRALCQDFMAQGKPLHTAMVCPGFTDTEMLRTHINHDEDILTAIACRNGFNRLIRPDEIAEIAYQAALNPVLNGSLIHANLGQRD